MILYLAKKLVRVISALDALFRKLTRFFVRPFWERSGRCRRCGECCKLIGIEIEDRLARFRPIRALIIWWVKTFNGFHFHSWDRPFQTLLFTCEHFKAGKCADYRGRPQLCKDYPPIRKYFEKPVFFETCGYKAVLSKGLSARRHGPKVKI